jgi:chromosome segregation ATPase
MLSALVATFLCLPAAHSQQRRRRTSRRATHPVRPQPVQTPAASSEPSVISTADDQQPQETPRRTPARARRDANPQAENEQLRGNVRDLSSQVDKLSGALTQMKTEQRQLFDLERLTRAEQRAETLRAQLRDVTNQEFQYQERRAQLEDELEPDAIQRRAALVGSLNPSSVRDSIQRSLERERDRVQKQLEMLANSRTRLETAVNTADAEVERLRQRVDAADQQQANPNAGAEATGPANIPETPQPSPTPTPAQPPLE